MKILAIGDVVGVRAIEYLEKNLWKKRSELGVDFAVVNAENASDIHGLCSRDADRVLDAGADLITLGNHTWSKRDLYQYLDNNAGKIIRPANYPKMLAGFGHTVADVGGYKILCINIMGNAFIDNLSCPFETVDMILAAEKGNYDFALMDIHAESTSEKYAIARYFDGRIKIMYGTHTHVQTADEQILPNGSGYITDLGMAGAIHGILGTDPEAIIRKFRTHMPTKFTPAEGEIKACGVLFEIDENDDFKVKSVKRVRF